MDFSDIKKKLVEEKDKVEQGLGKIGDAVKAKFGHDDQVDRASPRRTSTWTSRRPSATAAPAAPAV